VGYERLAVGDAGIEHPRDAGMMELGGNADLARKALRAQQRGEIGT
jgi:hypothetical protein